MINVSHNSTICQSMEPFDDIDDPIEILLKESTASLEHPLGGYDDLLSKYSNLHETYKKELESSKKVEKCLVKCLNFYSRLCKKYEAQQKLILKLEESLKEKKDALEESLKTQEKMKGLIGMYSLERNLYSGVSNEDLRHEKKILLDICCKLISESVRTNNTRNLTNTILTKFKKDLDEEKLNLLKGKDFGVKKEMIKIKRSNSLSSEDLKPSISEENETKFSDVKNKIEEKYSIDGDASKVEVKKLEDVAKLSVDPLRQQALIPKSVEDESKSCVELPTGDVQSNNLTAKEYNVVSPVKNEKEIAENLDSGCDNDSVPSSLPFLDEESGSENESSFKLNSFDIVFGGESGGVCSIVTPIKSPQPKNECETSSRVTNHVENYEFSAVQCNSNDDLKDRSEEVNSKFKSSPSELEGIENTTILNTKTSMDDLSQGDSESNNEKAEPFSYSLQKPVSRSYGKRRRGDLKDKLPENPHLKPNNVEENTRKECFSSIANSEFQKPKTQSVFDISNEETDGCKMGKGEFPLLSVRVNDVFDSPMSPETNDLSFDSCTESHKMGSYTANKTAHRRKSTEGGTSEEINVFSISSHEFQKPKIQSIFDITNENTSDCEMRNGCSRKVEELPSRSFKMNNLFDSPMSSEGNSSSSELGGHSKNNIDKISKNEVMENNYSHFPNDGENALYSVPLISRPDLQSKNEVLLKNGVGKITSNSSFARSYQREKHLSDCSDTDGLFDTPGSPEITTNCSDFKKGNKTKENRIRTYTGKKVGKEATENFSGEKHSKATIEREKGSLETYVPGNKYHGIFDTSKKVTEGSCKNVNFSRSKAHKEEKFNCKLDSLFGEPLSSNSDQNCSNSFVKKGSLLDSQSSFGAVSINERKIEMCRPKAVEEGTANKNCVLDPLVCGSQGQNSNPSVFDIPVEAGETNSCDFEKKNHEDELSVCFESNGGSFDPLVNNKLGNEFSELGNPSKNSESRKDTRTTNYCQEETEGELTEDELYIIFRKTSVVRLLSPIRELNHQKSLPKSSLPSKETDGSREQSSKISVLPEANKELRKRKDSHSSSTSCETSCKRKKLKGNDSGKKKEGGLLDSIISAMSIQNEEFKGAIGSKKAEVVEASHSELRTAETVVVADSFQAGTTTSEFTESAREPPRRPSREISVPRRQTTTFGSPSKPNKPLNTQNTKEKYAATNKFVMEKLKNFVSKAFSEEDIEADVKPFLSVLNDKPEEVVAKCIVAVVFENVDEQLEVFERPIPSLTKTQHRLFVLLSVLKSQGTNYEKLSSAILTVIFEKLFPDQFFWYDECVETASRFYAAICKMRNDLKSFWKLCLRSVTDMKQRCSLVVFTALKTWPDALHQASTLKNNILAMTVVNIFLHMPKEDGLRNANQKKKLMFLKTLLMDFYGFKIEDTIENYTGKVFHSFEKEEQGSRKCLVLLAECRNWSWTNKHILSRLTKLMDDWIENKTEDSTGNRILAVIKDISVVCKGGNDKRRVKDIVSCLSHVLTSGQMSHNLEQKVIEILLEMKHHPEAREVIREWIPKGAISESLRNEIINASAENVLREVKPSNHKKDSPQRSGNKKFSKKFKGKKKKKKKNKQQDLKLRSSPRQ